MSDIDAPDHYSSTVCAADVYPHGATITSWAPTGQRPVLWLSDHAVFDSSTAIRGGIPVCFPWFARGTSGTRTPAHGSARLSRWHRTSARTGDLGTEATYELSGVGYRASYRMAFGSELDLTLVVTNTSDSVFEFEEALHTYLAVSDVRQIRIEGLDGVDYFCNVTKTYPTQHGDARFDGEFDRVFETGGPIRVIDPGWNRILEVTRTGSANSIIWNPWAQVASELADFGNDEWTDMVCVEGGNVRQNAIRLEPGASHAMCYHVAVLPLA